MNTEAQKHNKIGNDAFKKEDFVTALKNYGKAIELDSKEVIYYNNSAAVYFQMNLSMNHFDICIKFCHQKNWAKSKLIFKGFERMGRSKLKNKVNFCQNELIAEYITHVYYPNFFLMKKKIVQLLLSWRSFLDLLEKKGPAYFFVKPILKFKRTIYL